MSKNDRRLFLRFDEIGCIIESNKRESEDIHMKYIPNQPEPPDIERRYLTKDELRLIKDFRTLAPENQRKAIAYLRRLKQSQE